MSVPRVCERVGKGEESGLGLIAMVDGHGPETVMGVMRAGWWWLGCVTRDGEGDRPFCCHLVLTMGFSR